jgi:hypothetical protein
MDDIFGNLLSWAVQFVLFVPFQILKLVGLLMPLCSTLGIIQVSQEALTGLGNWIRFFWPVLQYLPWSFIWNYIAAIILYLLFKWVWGHLPQMIALGFKFWIVVVILYVVALAVSMFTSVSYQDAPVFTDVFGASSTVNGAVDGGAGGGGGGSW